MTAKSGITTSGISGIEKNLSLVLQGIHNHSSTGLHVAATLIKGESQELTSIDEGALIKSAFNMDISDDKGPGQMVGYTAEYAPYVHGMPDDTNWNRPGAENEFLEKAVLRNLSKVLNIIVRHARKPIL